MLRGLVILALVGGLWYYFDLRLGHLPPDTGFEALSEFRSVSPEHYDKAIDAARSFEKERLGERNLGEMAKFTSIILENLNVLALYLPNDAARRDRLDAMIRQTETALQQDMTEGYELCPSPFPFRDFYFHRSGVAPTLLSPTLVQG